MQNSEISIRREIFFLITRDRNPKVRKAALELVLKNIKSIGIELFIQNLDVEQLDFIQQKEFFRSLKHVLINIEENSLKELLTESLINKMIKKTIVFYEIILARVVIESLYNKSNELIYNILPFEKILDLFSYRDPLFPFAYTQNLLKICKCLDIGDENIRKALIKTITDQCFSYEIFTKPGTIEKVYFLMLNDDFCAENSIEVLKVMVKLLKDLLDSNENEFCRIMLEIINEIRDPLNALQEDEKSAVFIEDTQRQPSLIEKKEALSRKLLNLEDEIELLENERENLIEKNEYSEALALQKNVIEVKVKSAEDCDKKLKELENIIKDKLFRALVLITEMLRLIKHGFMHIDVLDLISSIINPAFNISDESLQALALECLAQCCLHKLEVCHRYIYLYKTVLDANCQSLMEFIALQSILDIYLVWDLSDLSKNNEETLEVSNDALF